MAKVVVNNVNKIYDNGFQAVTEVNFTAEDKEFVILVGPSGCGKSTTLRMIAGLEEITSGEISIGDRIVNDIPPKDRDIAMVFQNYALYPHMTVYENMSFALKLRKVPRSQIVPIVKDAARLLEIEDLLDRKPRQLSGGQRQRVALGRAIVRQPKVFLFDEPLSNLDAKLRVQMRAEITRLHRKLDTTMIYVTHDQVEAMTMADKIVIMKDGFIQQIDSPLNVYNNPVNLFVAGFIGSPAINQFSGTIIPENGKLCFAEGSFKVDIPPEFNAALDKHQNKAVIMGLRPEDIYDAKFDTMAEKPVKISAMCDLVEPMGNEYVVYFSIGKSKIIARLDPKKLPKIDENMTVSLDMFKAHFFEAESKNCLTYK
ncbi:MAG: sn-glycerol-3-phosphate ABC transporter ATP-binding protein UgpC [Candidatus Cloacimonetes bacterium]|nr:sn-glycerol-3-phosphate ABC transporter ATP-binding protein UgpC [Candidatus Cloacimonadota bacterium]